MGDRFCGRLFPLFEEGADTRAKASVPGELGASLMATPCDPIWTAYNSPRIRCAHVGPLFKEGENDVCNPTKSVTHSVKMGRIALFCGA